MGRGRMVCLIQFNLLFLFYSILFWVGLLMMAVYDTYFKRTCACLFGFDLSDRRVDF